MGRGGLTGKTSAECVVANREGGGAALRRDLRGLLTADTLARIIPILIWPIVVRRLGAESLGRYSFAMAAISFVSLAASFGIVPYAVRELAQSPQDRWPAIVRGVLKLRIALVGIVFCLALAALTMAPLPPGTRGLLAISSIGIVVSWPDVGWVFLARGHARRMAFAGLGGQVLTGGLAVALVHRPEDVYLYAAATVAGGALSVILVWLQALRHEPWIRATLARPKEAFRPDRKEVVTLGAASLGSVLYNRADVVLLGYLVPASALGLYSAAYKLFEFGLGAITVIFQALFGSLARSASNVSALEAAARRAVRILGAVILPGGVATFLLAEPALRIACGASFVEAAPYLRILSFGLPAAALASIGAAGFLMLARRSTTYATVVWSAGFLNVVLNLLLIPRLGVAAAAATTVGSQAFVAIASIAFRPKGVRLSFLAPASLGFGAGVILLSVLLVFTRLLPLTRWADLTALSFAVGVCGLSLWASIRSRAVAEDEG